jgi:hypothetical protein
VEDVAELLVGPMLRHVTATSATVFVETDGPCEVEVVGHRVPTFTVAGHHYALVIVEGLEPASVVEYQVRLDGVVRWPLADSRLPPSVIRTLGEARDDEPFSILFGSCRAAAPHEPPWSLSATADPRGRGVDVLRAHGLRMLPEPPDSWPRLLVLLGDQVYADEPSPETRARMESTRPPGREPDGIVDGFEEYTWLYQESWRPEIERWIFSVVPTAMIFDDHEMIDDWNISASWVRETRRQPWWGDHVLGALMSYWIYQHLGNLGPEDIRAEGILDRLLEARDGTAILREWAMESERFTPVTGGYRFSFARDIGRTRLVVVDSRNGRVLEPDRAMVDDDEWAWVVERCRAPVDHLLIASSLPVLMPAGVHGLQVWNAALCDGAWGRRIAGWSERLRRYLDLEHWSAFAPSLTRLLDLLREIAIGADGGGPPPAVVAVLSGDVHFSYVARLATPGGSSRVYQVVSSPIRNSIPRRDRRVLRFTTSRAGMAFGDLLMRISRRGRVPVTWELTHGPEFANEMGLLRIDGREVELVVERARHDDDGRDVLEVSIRTGL